MEAWIERNRHKIIDIFGTDFDDIHNDNDMAYKCPFCKERGIIKEHNDKKLYVSYRNMKFYCFRCKVRGKLAKIDDTYGIYDKLLSLSSYYSKKEDEDDNEDTDMFYVPNIKIAKRTVAYEYLMSRHFTDEHISYYDLRLGKDDLFGRIIVPNKTFGETGIFVDMYSARSYLGQEPRYKNPVGARKSTIVFNLHRIKENPETLFIVEGAITAIHAGKDAVAVYGSHPSESQINQIVSKNAKEYYCNLDNDEAGRQSNLDMAESIRLLRPDSTIYLVTPPEGIDAADWGEKRYKEFVMDTRQKYHGNVYGKLLSVYNSIKSLKGVMPND